MSHLNRLYWWLIKILEGTTVSYQLPNEYFKINKSLFIISGLWPLQSKMRRIFATIFFNLVMDLILFMLILEVLLTPHRNFPYLTKCSMYIIPTTSNIAAYNTLSYNAKALMDVLIRIDEFWTMLETKDEIRTAEAFVRESRDYTVLLIVFVILFVIAVCIQNMFPLFLDIFVPLNETRSHKLAVPIYIPIDEEKYYVLIYIGFITWSVLFSLTLSTSHSMSMLATEHLCASLEIVGHILTVTPKNAKSNDMDEQIIRGIRVHKKTLQFLDVINKTWEYSYLVQVGYASIVTIIDVLHIFNLKMILKESLNEAVVCILYVITSATFILVGFSIGQKLLNASSKFYKTVCTLPWYEYSMKTQKLLILMILRSKKDCYLSVGKTYKVSFELYASIFRTALSIGMMIHSLR